MHNFCEIWPHGMFIHAFILSSANIKKREDAATQGKHLPIFISFCTLAVISFFGF